MEQHGKQGWNMDFHTVLQGLVVPWSRQVDKLLMYKTIRIR